LIKPQEKKTFFSRGAGVSTGKGEKPTSSWERGKGTIFGHAWDTVTKKILMGRKDDKQELIRGEPQLEKRDLLKSTNPDENQES